VTVPQKAALSLLISVFLFAGFAVLAFTGLFDLVEARFYNPSITRSLNREVALDGEAVQDFLAELQSRFAETLNEAAVRHSVLPNQSSEDIFERSRIYGTLLESLGGLQSVRFVDSGGQRIHFSTASRDIQNQDRLSISYRNYPDDPSSLPYDQVEVPAQGTAKFTLDEGGDRIILSFPFYDTFEVYRGTALFSVSVRAVAERLISRNRIKVGDDVAIVSRPPGFVSGLPGTARLGIVSRVSSIWNDGLLSLTPLDSEASETTLALISTKTDQGIFVGRMVDETLFTFPQSMKVILLVSIFLTIYLVIFLTFNLRQDTMTVVQNRLKGLQISLIEQYYERKGDIDWTRWTRELEQRRDDIRAEIKRGIRFNQGRRSEEDIDSLIDKSWDELLTVIGGRRNAAPGMDEEKLQSILNRVLQALPAGISAPGLPPAAQALPPTAREKAPPVEEPEDLEELAEAPAELAEEVEELAEAPEELIEEVEELAEAPRPPEEAAEVEELPALEMAEAAGGATHMDMAEQNVDSLINAMALGDEPAELEELDAEDLEELGPVDGEAVEPKAPSDSLRTPAAYTTDLASKIEFGTPANTHEADDPDQLMDVDLEIVSPFATLLSNVSVREDPNDNFDDDGPPGDYSLDDDLPAFGSFGSESADFAEEPEDAKKKSVR
jgi:hypothetical protein